MKCVACLVDNAFEHRRREDKCEVEHQCRGGTSSVQVCSTASRVSVYIMCEGGPRTSSRYGKNQVVVSDEGW